MVYFSKVPIAESVSGIDSGMWLYSFTIEATFNKLRVDKEAYLCFNVL